MVLSRLEYPLTQERGREGGGDGEKRGLRRKCGRGDRRGRVIGEGYRRRGGRLGGDADVDV